MLTEVQNDQTFPMTETPKTIPWVFLCLGIFIFFMGVIGDSAKFSPQGFDAYELLCVVMGSVFVFITISLLIARRKSLPVVWLPEKQLRQLTFALILCGMSLSVLSGVTLSKQTNTKDMFADVVRIPPVESARFANMDLVFIAGFVVIFLATQIDQRGRKIISAILSSTIDLWKAIPQRIKVILFLVIVVSLGAFNYGVVMHDPFTVDYGWDNWTGAYRKMIVVSSNEGLKQGCNLCTQDLKPLESTTNGDDIGLSFAFGVVVQMGLFRPDLDSYQHFIALLVAGAIASGALFVAIGYRSIFAGLLFGIFISLFSSVPLYQSLLTTMYWVPGGAAIVTSALILAFIARAEMVPGRSRWETLLYVIGIAIWGFVGGLSYLGRANAGVSMLFPALVVLLYLLARYRWYMRVPLLLAVLLVSAFVPILAFRNTLSWRFGVYNPPNPVDTGHSFSHALYVGLGYVTNSEDLRWLDDVGFRHAQEQCSPTIVILSADYYQCVRNLFIKTIIDDPNLLIRNLLAKSESILQTSLTHLSFFWLLPLLTVFIRRRFIYLVLAFALVMFLLPGLLVFPYFSYMVGYEEVLIAALVVGLISFSQSLYSSVTMPKLQIDSPA